MSTTALPTTLSPSLRDSQQRRRDWFRARLSKLEMKDARKGMNRQDRATYGRYLDEYEALTQGGA